MASPNQNHIASFLRRCPPELAALARALAGAIAGGDDALATLLTYKGELLRQGLRSVGTATNRLSEQERIYIAEKLLGLLPEDSQPASPATLTLDQLTPRLRGQGMGSPVVLTGTVGGAPAQGAALVLLRDGKVISRQAARAGAYSFIDAQPGAYYRVELTGSSLYAERVRSLVSPLLYGCGTALADSSYLTRLTAEPPLFEDGKKRLSFTGQRNRILLAVPTSVGQVMLLTQPDDQDADITMAFSRVVQTLDFGLDGRDEYEVLLNYADFIGNFCLDAHLVANVSPVGADGENTAITIGSGSAGNGVVSYPFTLQSRVTIVHNMGRHVLVEIYDSSGRAIDGDVSYVDLNTVHVQFSQPLSGTIVLR